MISSWGVRSRVMLVAVLPMLVLAVVLTALYTSSRLADLDLAHAARGQAFARQLAVASEYAVFSGNQAALQQLASAMMAESDVSGITIIDTEGGTLATVGRLDATLPLPPATNVPPAVLTHGRVLRIVEPIHPSSLQLDDTFPTPAAPPPLAQAPATLGTVVLDMSRARLEARRFELLRAGIGSALLVLVGSLLLASAMSRDVSGPIRRIADAVVRIGQGYFLERVPVGGGGSLRTLAEGVNEMAARLASAHEEMSRQVEEATAELRTRKEEAERANLAKSRFLAAASHDLRQPMHALGLFIAELGQHQHSPAVRRLVERIAASADAMENLLDSLLDISKLDAGVMQANKRAFPLQPVFDRIAVHQTPEARERGLELKFRPTRYWLDSDPVLIERILGNLITNAIRYTRKGRILVACRPRGERVRIEVRDSGIGIAPEALESIFQEFVQLDNPERARDKGLGLGLAIVRRLTDLLGHRLSVRSAPERGSTFSIELDLASPEESIERRVDRREPGDLAGTRIALVDDDPLALSAMESLLSSWGCDVMSASDAGLLLDRFSPDEPLPQLIISDYRLRGPANGIEVIRMLRSVYGSAIPAVLISGDTGPEVLRQAQDEGLSLLHKPVRPARLRALLNRLAESD